MRKIKTSQENWIEEATKCYIAKEKFVIEDDSSIGIIESDMESAITLIKAVERSKNLSWKQIIGVLAGLGVSSAGILVIRLAIIDPEPTTKLSLLISGGIILALTGAFGVFASLGTRFSVSLEVPSGHRFSIQPHNYKNSL